MSDVYNSKLGKFLTGIEKFLGILEKDKDYALTLTKNTVLYPCDESKVSAHWRAHEEEHKKQLATYGWIPFVIMYLIETIKHGYENNKYEIEARVAADKVR